MKLRVNLLLRVWLWLIFLSVTALSAGAQDVGVWGWRAKGWINLLKQEYNIDAENLPGDGSGDILPLHQFNRFKLVIIGEGRPKSLTDEQHEELHRYLNEGGFLLINTISVSGMVEKREDSRDLSAAERWLGANRYSYGKIDAEVLAPEHPALTHLQHQDWFSALPGLTNLTTARNLIGAGEDARVLVNRVGKGGVIFISPEVGALYKKEQEQTDDTKALLQMIQVFLNAILINEPSIDEIFGMPVSAADFERAKRAVLAHAIVNKKEIPLVIESTAEGKAAAASLTKYLETSLGQKIGSAEQVDEQSVLRIHVGRTQYVESLNLDLKTLHPFGYYLKLVDGKNLVLAGPTTKANSYAVFDFLKRFIGYRYFAPGDLGEIVPRHTFLTLPNILDIREEPSVASYTNAGLFQGNENFSRSSRTTLYATHSLGKLIPSEKYGATHPEYFPMYDGQRFIPNPKMGGTWQPCVSNPDLPKLAIEWAKEYFEARPEALGFPLGVNDGGGDCQCLDCQKAKATYGNQYIPFYNETARLAKEAFPGKYVAFIAYGGAKYPPAKIQLEDNILVEVTNMSKDDRQRVQGWRDAGMRHFGWYDYLYGGGQVTPRHYPHLMAQAWRRFAKEYGLKSLWVESFIRTWYFDGARQYVLNELAWNLNVSVDDLLRDYFENFYGPAAVPMQSLFERLEEIYVRREDPLHPMGDRKKPEQLQDFTAADLMVIRKLLREAQSKAGDGIYGQRLALFEKLWNLSELFVKSHLAVQGVEALKGGEEGWDKFVAEGYETFRKIEEFRLSPEEERAIFVHQGLAQYKGLERLKMGPLLEVAVDHFFQRTEETFGENADAFFQKELKRVTSRDAHFLIESHLSEKHSLEAQKDLFATGDKEQAEHVVAEDWKNIGDIMPGWSTWHFQRSVTNFDVSNEETPDGKPALVIGQNDIAGSFLRTHAVWPGERYRIRFSVKQNEGSQPGTMNIRWKDKSGKWLPEANEGSQSPIYQRCPAPNGEWQKVSVLFTVPEGARYMTVLLGAPQQAAPRTIRFHGVSLYKVYDARWSRKTAAVSSIEYSL